MKQVYKCEFCKEISENKKEILNHENICGSNPINTISDEIITKFSRIEKSVEDAMTYVLLSDYKEKLNYFYDEYDRATKTNCLGSIYEQSGKIKGLISRAKRIERNEFKWFMNITQRDKPEFIDAIRTYIREREFRI